MIATARHTLCRRDYFLLSGLLGSLYVLALLGPEFLLGIGAFWVYPKGIMGGAGKDMVTSVAANLAFIVDAWQWPKLFHLSLVNTPTGANIAQTDSIPWLALLARLWFTLTGQVWNLVGAFIGLSFVLNGLGMAAIARALGHRDITAAVLSTVSGLLMPALLWRFGHISLTAHFLIVAALVLYLLGRREDWQLRRINQSFAGLVCVALLTTPYLFAMVLPIMLAHLAQARIERRMRLRDAVWLFAALTPAMLAIMYASDFIGGNAVGPGRGFGVYSMNLLSPFWPQSSTLFGLTGNFYLTRGVIGGTAGQYEGYNYLGAGILLLLLVTFPRTLTELRAVLTRHPPLTLLMAAFTVFAMSNKVYLGPALVLDVPLPDGAISELFNQFRSSGRFFWPVAYLLAAFAIHRLLSGVDARRVVITAAIVIALQFVDTLGLQSRIHAAVHSPTPPQIPTATLAKLLRGKQALMVYPTMHCQSWASPDQRINAQLIMAAAQHRMASNDVHVARADSIDCDKVKQPPDPIQPATLYVINPAHASEIASWLESHGADCKTVARFRFCARGAARPR